MSHALTRVFKRWASVVGEYSDRVNWKGGRCADAVYWSTERANVGSVAAAAWLTGGVALEEYGDLKRAPRRVSKGRVDLFVKCDDASEYLFECKTAWVGLDDAGRLRRPHAKKRIGAVMRAVRKDANRLQREPGQLRGLILFAIPSIRVGVTHWRKRVKLLHKDDQAWLEELLRGRLGKRAFVEASRISANCRRTPCDGQSEYPGVILLCELLD